jgi:insulysin
VNADQLQPALDRFTQFFAAPLFSESATGRELNAIDSEHAKNINSDGFRLHQVGCSYSFLPGGVTGSGYTAA